MERKELIEQLMTLSVIFGTQLKSSKVQNTLLEAVRDVENIGKIEDALSEVAKLYQDKYKIMDKSYWDGAQMVMDTMRRHLVNEGG